MEQKEMPQHNQIICSVCKKVIPEDMDWILTPEGYKCEACWEITTEKMKQ